MNNDNDMIEILDDVNENNKDNNTLNNPSIVNNDVQSQQGLYQEQPVNQPSVNMVQNQPNEVKYDPIDKTPEEIKIEQESESEKSKSGLGFVIVLFIIIGAFIFALPYIAKYFR